MKYKALFLNDEHLINIEPVFFKDLKLDIIANACFGNKDDSYLIPYFYTALNDKESIIYRQEVFPYFGQYGGGVQYDLGKPIAELIVDEILRRF